MTKARSALPTRRAVIAGATALCLARPALGAAPARIVSLNPCLDAILLRLVPRERIAALSHYARETSSSTIADIAATIPITYETAEEVAVLRPDLVLTTRHNAIPTRQALESLGIKSVLFAVPDTVEDSLTQVRAVAEACSVAEAGETLIAEINAALAAAAPPPGRRPIEALVFHAGGFVAGTGTLVDDMLRRTGFSNAAARYGLSQWGFVSLEQLVADPPQLLLSGQVTAGSASWAQRVMNHPALAAVGARMKRAVFGEALLYCGGPVLEKSAAALAAARDAYWAGTL